MVTCQGERTVSKIEGLVHVGLHVGGGLLLRHVEGGHVTIKVEELSVGEHGKVIVKGTEFLLGGQVGGRGHSVQVGNVLRHIGSATGAVGRHDGRKRAAGARRRWVLLQKSEAAGSSMYRWYEGVAGRSRGLEGPWGGCVLLSSEAGGKQSAEFECDVLNLQSLGALSTLEPTWHVRRNSPRFALCRSSAFVRFVPLDSSSLCQSLLSFHPVPLVNRSTRITSACPCRLFLEDAIVLAALLLFFSSHLCTSYCSPPLHSVSLL